MIGANADPTSILPQIVNSVGSILLLGEIMHLDGFAAGWRLWRCPVLNGASSRTTCSGSSLPSIVPPPALFRRWIAACSAGRKSPARSPALPRELESGEVFRASHAALPKPSTNTALAPPSRTYSVFCECETNSPRTAIRPSGVGRFVCRRLPFRALPPPRRPADVGECGGADVLGD